MRNLARVTEAAMMAALFVGGIAFTYAMLDWYLFAPYECVNCDPE